MEKSKEYSIMIRILHWSHFSALIALTITGLYIAIGGKMGMMRFVHFIFAYVIALDVVIRTYLAFFSREKADWRDFVPDIKSLKLVIPTLKHYIYKKDYKHITDEYNPIQKLAYLFFFLLIMVQIITGFSLYDGNFFAITNSRELFSPVTSLLGGLPRVRLIHYITTLIFIVLTAVHFYMAVWTDLYEKNNVFSSIFTGYKIRKDEN